MNRKTVVSLSAITLGAFIFALGINLFAIPNQMAEGGITGITLLLYYTLNIPISLSNIVLNTLLVIIGFRFLNKSTIFYTIYTYFAISFLIEFTKPFQLVMNDKILVALATGFSIGLSIGIIMLAGGSTAGIDILALMLNKHFHIPTSVAMLFLDICIILPSAFVVGFETMLYTFISLFVSVKIIDFILLGLNPKKTVMIVSEQHAAIAERISKGMSRGVTVLNGYGYFSGQERKVLFVVLDRKQVIDLTKFVTTIDPRAFYTVTNVHSVIGEGFTFHLNG